jgi:hypothetical protein
MESKSQIRAEITLASIVSVLDNPKFKKEGMSASVLNNGSITLLTGSRNEYHTHSLSLEDSRSIMNIIRISAEEALSKIK